jgi:hypothetical protein
MKASTRNQKIRARITGRAADTAYIALPGYETKPGIVKKMINLDDAIENYKGPRVHLDFNVDGVLIGIEILA